MDTGITPAWAGKSYNNGHSAILHRDHPRVGGEKKRRWKRWTRNRGSPPRGRGKGCGGILGLRVARITPAWAGKRGPAGARPWPPQDHPRVGGEKSFWNSVQQAQRGSPPRGRGKGSLKLGAQVRRGITPAWAGKSSCRFILGQLARDHPRVGGEKPRCQR